MADVLVLDAFRARHRAAPLATRAAGRRGDRVMVVVLSLPDREHLDVDEVAREVARALGGAAPTISATPTAVPPRREAVGDLLLDRPARQLRAADGAPVALTRTEFELLCLMLDRAGTVVSRDAILDAVWGEDVVVGPRTIDNFVASLKRKLAAAGDPGLRLVAVRGVGYRLERDAAARATGEPAR